jgi:hypothetical protein
MMNKMEKIAKGTTVKISTAELLKQRLDSISPRMSSLYSGHLIEVSYDRIKPF